MPFDDTVRAPHRPCPTRWHRLRRPALLVLRELAGGVLSAGISDAGKQAARDALTGGVPLIACPEPVGESPEAGP